METIAIIETINYYAVEAKVVLENDQLIFSTKPRWVRYVFGFVGVAIAPYKERFKINLTDVISVKFSKTMFGKPMCKIVYGYAKDYCYISFSSKDDDMVNEIKTKLKDVVIL